MKIIDIKEYGHLIKLFLGKDDLIDYWGDDWNDTPYEHNAEEVYERFVEKTIEIPISTKFAIASPENDYTYMGNSPFSKEDFKNGVPFLVIGKESSFDFLYSNEVNKNEKIAEIYYNDSKNVEDSKNMLLDAYVIQEEKVEKQKAILEIIE